MAKHFREASAGGGLRISWGASHRDGICNKCQVPFVKVETTKEGKTIIEALCPKCGGREGNLIVRFVGVYPPNPPMCLKPSCLWSYLIDSLTFAFVASYHRRRIVYAEANRGKKILERYRTGEPSPQTLWQAIHASIKLTCPICRKYDVDPLL